MYWETTLELLTTWYYVLIAIIMAVGLYATWKHGKAIPVMWALTVSLVLWYGATYLDPILFGFEYYALYSLQWILSTVFTVLFVLLYGTYCFNLITKGTVIE